MKAVKMPKNSNASRSNSRHYGLEFEYMGVPLRKAADIVADITGGKLHEEYSTRLSIDTQDMGEFIVELDVELAQKISKRAQEHKENPELGVSLDSIADHIVPGLLSPVAPSEIVTPPLQMKDIECVEKIIDALRREGAQGTSRSFLFAFGYHINPEALSMEAAEIRDTIRSFILLSDWLMTRLNMDVTRKLTGFAGPYADEYTALILNDSYEPDMSALIRDYIRFNPSRNYALDMLPLFSHIDEDLVNSLIEESLIKKRPTYHFRMPNCNIDDKNWSIHTGLECWFTVEALADDKTLLSDLCAAYTGQRHKEFISRLDPDWVTFVQNKLDAARITS